MSDQENNQIPNPFANIKISAAEFGAKYRSKRECYNFLSVDCGVYLPSYGKLSSFTRILIYYNPNCHFNLDQVTIYFLKDLISGKKKRSLERMSDIFQFHNTKALLSKTQQNSLRHMIKQPIICLMKAKFKNFQNNGQQIYVQQS